MIPEQHTAYHTLTIFHTGDKLKFGRQIAWKCVALWKHSSKLVALYGQVLVASTDKFWWHSTDKIGGHSVCVQCGGVSQQQTQEPPQEVLVVVISCKFGGHVMQIWWSFGSAKVRCHGWVVLRLRLRCANLV